MTKILVVEDEEGIRKFIKEVLEDAGYQIELAIDGVEAITKFKQNDFDLILLDIMLPKADGYAVSEIIRMDSDVLIIMLTALSDEHSQIKGFDYQVDDYLTKPFSYKILLKRVEALLRRNKNPQREQSILTIDEVKLDKRTHQVFISSNEVTLTSIEYKLLQTLMEHQNQVLTREQLLESVWGFDYYESSEKLVNHHIMNIRKKVNGDYIETVRGVGYRIVSKNQK